MPKFKKETEKRTKKKKKQISDDEFAYRSVLISAIIGGIFLIISLFINGTEMFFDGVLVHIIDEEIKYKVNDQTIKVNEWVDNSLKVAVILLSFFFILISVGNYKELTGKPASMKEGILLFGLSLAQTIRILWVFIGTIIGLPLILVYLYLVQES